MPEPDSHNSENATPMLSRAWGWLKSLSTTAKYLFLLVSLETLTWTPAFWGDSKAAQGGTGWDDLIVAVTLLSAVLAISRKRAVTVAGFALAIAAFATAWVSEVWPTAALCVSGDALMAVFFGFIASMILHDVWTTRGVTSDTILGAVCGYLMVGATWAFCYSLTEMAVPGSFQLTTTAEGVSAKDILCHSDYPLFMYYSFVTLCSLGYGEMLPVKPAARMLACAEAIVGQFYMAVFVARLIAQHLTQTRDETQG